MAESFRVTLAQLNPTVGDLRGNAEAARRAWDEGKAAGVDLVALPELFLTGYNPQDLIRKPAFYLDCMAVLDELAQDCADGPAIAIGAPWREGAELFNAYHILEKGAVRATLLKHHLPNDQVFDEERIFTSAPISGPLGLGPLRAGFPICEDAWHEDVAETHEETGAELLIVPNGSPYHRDKFDLRLNMMVARVIETGLPLVYLNMVGGQDDQIFDGGSFVLNPGGEMALKLPAFEEAIAHVSFVNGPDGWRAEPGPVARHGDSLEQDYHAMVLALRDYLRKTGFKKVLLGLSGGVDSALVAVIAGDAIGPENVRCVMLPSEYTSEHSLEDAKDLAKRLGAPYDFVPIDKGRAAISETLG